MIELFHPLIILASCLIVGGSFYGLLKFYSEGFWMNLGLLIISIGVLMYYFNLDSQRIRIILFYACPLLLINIVLYVFFGSGELDTSAPKKYKVRFKTTTGDFYIDNVRRGVSITGAAGSGKTESVVYPFLQHFRKYNFSGVIHDYKDFELTEMVYPLYKDSDIPFYIISFDTIVHRVNPIAPRYLPNEESVNEVSRVLLENLLELKESGTHGTSKFFNDAVEGLIAGLIWRLKTDYPHCCTLPHLINLYQKLDTDSLIHFLSANPISKAMASAFIQGKDSAKQTAGVKSTLANAFKKITSEKIFHVLSGDDVPLDVNNPEHPAVVSIVNNPKYDASFSPVIATIIHTMVKQMSVRNRESSFIMLEEAPTIRLLNMHRIPATLRSYDIATIYVMQDKIQNDMMYGDKGSKSILSNLSYQFFGKANDPDTAKYYERFFELVLQKTTSVSRSDGLDFDTRITRGEREVARIRASSFFKLKPGQFVILADGNTQFICFNSQKFARNTFKNIAGEELLYHRQYQSIREDLDKLFD
ncbi:type IV secretory system conjugative DNA transfer family protein [Zunongwangia sp. HGR-M22]|uniref:type IV secretory system conjugative DNA transfer family protein n=1 Tax=Zunongwangia sp. HGR-M22 TaxID=3015168 RepID=UPI003FCE5639